jgi:galactokinase
MAKTTDKLKVSTPGRVCLFGEHQDYLNLPVIPCAISLRISIEGRRRKDSLMHIRMPDIGREESFRIDRPLSYAAERDYYKSSVNVLLKHGFRFSSGFDCVVRGKIPINSGTSSSSALVVTWVNFLAQASEAGKTPEPSEIARYAHEAEVLEFGEPGGMMDQYSTAYGGVIAIEFYPELKVDVIRTGVNDFVLGDSGQAKDTKRILARVKDRVLDMVKRISGKDASFSLHTAAPDVAGEFRKILDKPERELLAGTLCNRDITALGKKLLKKARLDHAGLGNLLTEHHSVLRDVLKISTDKIDGMIDASLQAGALGGKINGSGGGGCMFAYAPGKQEEVADAIRRAGGRPYIVSVDEGTRNE